MAERVARQFAEATGIALRAAPLEAPPFPIELVHSRKSGGDAAMRWLAGVMKRAVRLSGPPDPDEPYLVGINALAAADTRNSWAASTQRIWVSWPRMKACP